MNEVTKPQCSMWQDLEGTIPADKEGDRVARIDYPAGVWWLHQPAVAHRPTIVDGEVLIDHGERLESSAELKP